MIENKKLIAQLDSLWWGKLIAGIHIVAYSTLIVVGAYLGWGSLEIVLPLPALILFFLSYVDCQRQIDYNIRMLLSNSSFDLKDVEKPYLASAIMNYRQTEKRYFSNSNKE